MYFHSRNSTDFTALKQFMSNLTLLFSPCAAHFKLPGDTGHFKLSGDTCVALSEASTYVSGCNQRRSVSYSTDIYQEDSNFLLALPYITASCENVNGAIIEISVYSNDLL